MSWVFRLRAAGVAAAFAVAVVAVPATSLAVGAHDAKAAPLLPPKTGLWQIMEGNGDVGFTGGFTVSGNHNVTALHGTIQSGASLDCGSGPVTVAGQHKIIRINIRPEGYVYNFYEVGGIAPHSPVPDPPIKVMLEESGKPIQGTLFIEFSPKESRGSGDITYANGMCDLAFNIKHD